MTTIYREVDLYDIKHNPYKVNCIIGTNAYHFSNELYILADGNHFEFDNETRKALETLKKSLEKVLDK